MSTRNRVVTMCIAFMAAIVLAPKPLSAATNVISNVPEASYFSLLYEKSIPVNSPNWNGTVVPYDVNNAAGISQSFDRVAYYWELQKPGGGYDWIWVAVDPIVTNVTKLGIPNTNSGAFFQQNVSNMTVSSNVPGIVTGTLIATGNIEFWPSNYTANNDAGVPNASSSVFDFGDGGANTGAGYGSMQIHNYGARQTLFAYNNWGNTSASDLGIGNQAGGSGNPDWTFANNAGNYTARTLQVFVREVPLAVHTPNALAANNDAYDATNLLANGSFELGSNPGGVRPVAGGDNATIQSWQVTGKPSDTLNYVNGFWQTFNGSRSIDFASSNVAALKQTIATVAGQNYLVRFDMGGDNMRGQSAKSLRVTLTDPVNGNAQLAQQTFSFTNGLTINFANMDWQTQTLAFVAASNSTTVAFDNPSAPASPLNGAVLDNVVVTRKLAIATTAVLSAAAPGVLGNDRAPAAGETLDVTQLNGSTNLTGTSTQGATVTLNADGSFRFDPSTSAALQALGVGATMTDTFQYTASVTGIATGGSGSVFANVPEAAGYALAYQLQIPNTPNFNSAAIPYTVNNAASINYPFDRIAYYLELNNGSGLQYAYVSMDAFTSDPAKIGVPNVASGEFYQQNVNNINVVSNMAGIATGRGLGGGNLEFWPSNYTQANSNGVPNASSASGNGGYDFGDGGASTAAGYGSMQIHNHFVTPTTGQTIIAYNNWNGAGPSDLGIGNQAGGSGAPDWTFAGNANTYTVKTLQILVHPTSSTATATVSVAVTNIGSVIVPLPAGTNNIRLFLNVAGNREIDINGVLSQVISFSNSAGLNFIGSNESDTLTVDFVNGDPIPPGAILFDGGTPTGDRLIVANGSFGSVTNEFNGANSSRIILGATDVITCKGIVGVSFANVPIGGLTLMLPAGPDNTVIEDDGTPNNDVWQIRSTGGKFLTSAFPIPSASLTLNATGGETVAINSFDYNASTGPASISFKGNTGVNTFRLGASERIADGAALTLSGSAVFDLNGFTETIASLSDTIGGTTTALGSGTLILAGNSGSTTFDGTVMGSGGTLTKTGNATVTLGGNNSYSGTTRVFAGTLTAGPVTGGSTPLGSSTVNMAGGTLMFFAASQSYSNAINVTSDSTIDVRNSPASMGNLSIGGNTLSLTGDNGLSLTLGAAALSGNPVFDEAAGTTLVLGALGDGGAARVITKANSGTLMLGAPATSMVTGTQFSLAGGQLNSNNASALGTLADMIVAAGTTLNVGASQTISALNGPAGTANLNGNTLTIGSTNNLNASFGGLVANGSAAGALAKNGTGMLILSNTANSYSGGTTINAGILNFANGALGASGNVALAGGTLQYAAGNTQDLSARIKNSTGAVTLDTNGNTVAFGSAIDNTNTGGLTKLGAGTLSLNAASTYTGNTALNAGTLLVNNGAGSGTGNGSVTVNSGTLSGAGIISGALTIHSGSTVDPASVGGAPVGTLTTSSTVTLSAGSVFSIQLLAPGGSDRLLDTNASANNVNLGNATLAGITLPGFTASAGAVYTILQTSGSITGTFSNFPATGNNAAFGGEIFTIAYNASSVTLTDTGVQNPGPVYVNDDWSNTAYGADPDGTGLVVAQFGTTAFSDIQTAINAVATGGTVVVEGGTYPQAVALNRNVIFQFIADTVAGHAAQTTANINGPVSLSAAPSFSDAGGPFTIGDVSFGGTVDGAVNLNFAAIHSSVTFAAPVGSITPLTSLTTSTNASTNINASSLTASGAQTYNNPVTIGASAQIAAGSLTTGNVTLNNNLAIILSGSGTLSGTVSGNAGISVGGGILTLSGNNSYGGGTMLTGGGTIQVDTSTALGSASVVVDNTAGNQILLGTGVNVANPLSIQGGGIAGQAVLYVPANAATYSGNINITGAAVRGHFAGGTLTLSGAVTSSVPVVFSAGTIVLNGSGSNFSNATLAQGILQLGAASALPANLLLDIGTTGAGTFDLNGFDQTLNGITQDANPASVDTTAANATVTLALGNNGATGAFGGVIKTSGTNAILNLAKIGAGTLALSGANTYNGGTLVTNGALQLKSGLAPGAKIMPMGDSITYGVDGGGGGATNAGYRGPLYNLLTGAGFTFQFVGSYNPNPGSLPTTPVDETFHEGHSGWQTGNGGTGILHGVTPVASGGLGWLTVNPDLILIHIGTNNTSLPEPQSITDDGNTLDQIHTQLPNATTIVAQIIPRPSAPAWIGQYNADLVTLVASKKALGYNVILADLNTGFTGLGNDNLHPNATGYNFMAQQWYNAIATNSGATSNVLPTTTGISIGSGATLDLNGVNQTIASLSDFGSSGGSVVNSAAAKPLALTINPLSGSATFSGVIGDNGAASAIGIVKSGAGTQIFAGDNTYNGTTTINVGTLQIGLGGTSGSILDSSNVTDNDTLVFSRSDTYSYGGVITGGGAVIQNGTGSLTLAGANTYTGATTINNGILLVNGSLAAASNVAVTGGTLGGTGTVNGSVSVTNGTVSPGSPDTSPGILNSVATTFGSTSTYKIQLNGTAAGTQYDQFNVNGAIDLGNCTLSASLGFTPAMGAQFTIVASTGGAGGTTFGGLAERATVPFGGTRFQITYVGGTGNDVVLTRVPDSTTVTIGSSVNPSSFGQAVTITATVSGNAPGAAIPAGSVQFVIDGTNFGPQVTLAGGTASSTSTSTLALGDHTITVMYMGGAPNFIASSGTLLGGQNVKPAIASATLSGLAVTYDGTQKPVTVTTNPLGLSNSVTYNGLATAPTNAGSYNVAATITDPNYSGSTTATLVIGLATPVITWAAPAAIPAGTALSGTQLNATASMPGTFVYTPPVGTVLNSGQNQLLLAQFTPADTANYKSASLSVNITVTGSSPAPSNAAPVITSGPTVTTGPVIVGQPVQFFCSATDASALTWTWNFGDGTSDTNSGNGDVNTYSPAGTYTVTVTATDVNGLSTTQSFSLLVSPAVLAGGVDSQGNPVPNTLIDSDGDGFPDVIEAAEGTNPLDAHSTPFGGATASPVLPLQNVKLQIKLNFARGTRDTIRFSSSIGLSAGFNVNQKSILIYIGGVIKVFTLNAKGMAKKGMDAAKLTGKGKSTHTGKLTLICSKGQFAPTLAGSGLLNANANSTIHVQVIVLADNKYYQAFVLESYKAKTGKSGMAKSKR